MLFFFLGVLTTLGIIAIIKLYKKHSSAKRMIVNQSSIFALIKNFLPDLITDLRQVDTQAQWYEDTKIFDYIEMPDEKAYWIYRNKIYCTDVKDGKFNPAEGKPAEMKNLSEKQVTNVLHIYSSLKNGS